MLSCSFNRYKDDIEREDLGKIFHAEFSHSQSCITDTNKKGVVLSLTQTYIMLQFIWNELSNLL